METGYRVEDPDRCVLSEREKMPITGDDVQCSAGRCSSEHMVVVRVVSHHRNYFRLNDLRDLLHCCTYLSGSRPLHESSQHVFQLVEQDRTAHQLDPAT